MNAIAWLARSVIYVSTPRGSLQIALVGLAGVVVGAFITGGFSYWLEHRRERSATRRAARLIDADLLVAEVAARTCVEKKKWWGNDRRLTSEGWQQSRAVIASKLSEGDWVAVMSAVLALGDLQLARDGARHIQLAQLAIDSDTAGDFAASIRLGLDIADPGPCITEAAVTQIEPILKDLRAGRAALAPLTRDA